MAKRLIYLLTTFSVTFLIGCAGVTEFDNYIIESYRRILDKNESCTSNQRFPILVNCARSQLVEIQDTPESYLKPSMLKYAKSYLHLMNQSRGMSQEQFDAQLKYIVKVRDDDAIYAAKAERSRRDDDFLRRLGAAGKAYNESMQQFQQPTTTCTSQPNGLGGFTSVCR